MTDSAMHAWVYNRYGGPEVLQCVRADKPTPKAGQVLIRVRAVALNDWDWGLLKGDFANRLLNGWLAPKKYQVLGSDIAGEVEAVGKGVTQWAVGDEVYGDLSLEGFGGFAEYVCAPESALVRKPSGLSFEQVAAIPQAGMLAFQGLFEVERIQPGHNLLINGAGGGVGSLGIQLAKLQGVRQITGVDNAGKQEFMRDLGYDPVVDYMKEDFTQSGPRYDYILDTKTTRPPWTCAKALNPGGAYVTVGGTLGRLLQHFLLGWLVGWLTSKRLVIIALKPNRNLDYFNEMLEAGQIRPAIDGDYSFKQLPDAYRRFACGDHQGKLVVIVSKA